MTICHIRIGVVRAGRRMNDSRGNPGETICGAALTDRDITVFDVKLLKPGDEQRFNVCATCLSTFKRGHQR